MKSFFMLRGLQWTLPSCNIYFSILVRISFADLWDIFYWNYFLWGFIYKFKKELWDINVGFKKCLDGFHYGISLYGLKHLLSQVTSLQNEVELPSLPNCIILHSLFLITHKYKWAKIFHKYNSTHTIFSSYLYLQLCTLIIYTNVFYPFISLLASWWKNVYLIYPWFPEILDT